MTSQLVLSTFLIEQQLYSLEKVITKTKAPLFTIADGIIYDLRVVACSPMNKRFIILIYESQEQNVVTFIYDCETKEMKQLDRRWGLCQFSEDGQYLYRNGYDHIGVISLKENTLNYIFQHDLSSNCRNIISPCNNKIWVAENYLEYEDYPISQVLRSSVFDCYQSDSKYSISHAVAAIDFYHPKNVALLGGVYRYSSKRMNGEELSYEFRMCTYYNFDKKADIDFISHIEQNYPITFNYHEEEWCGAQIKDPFYHYAFFTKQGNILIQINEHIFMLQIQEL